MSVLAEKYFNHARSVAKEAAEDNNLSLGNSDEEAAATLSKITATARDIIMQIHAQQAAPKQLPQPPLQQLPPRQHKKSFTRGL